MEKGKLKKLIEATHARGVEIARKIRKLGSEEKGLEKLNAERREKLKGKEHLSNITMYDSVDVSQIPPRAQAVAGYVGGKWATFPELVRKFPHAHKLSIAVNATQDAECLDIEIGDATPKEAPQWVRRQINRGVHRPCLYANLSTMPSVQLEIYTAGIQRSKVRLWVAHYTDIPSIPQGYDACQYTDKALGKNLDASLCLGNFFD